MLETNIRIVEPGWDLSLCTRRPLVHGADDAPDLLQRACSRLLAQYGLAAIPYPGQSTNLLVAASQPIPALCLHGDEWELRVVDSSDSSQQWSLADPDGPSVLPRLLERALLAQIRARTDWWKLDSSRIWYEAQPFERQDGIAAYQRFQIATLLIEGVGVGIAVDIGTAFFTLDSLAYFFDPSVSATEQARRKRQFDHLTNRQVGQKGTLLYDTGRSQTKCYFESAPHDATCAGTGSIRVRKRSYPSLLEYYRDQHPHMGVTADDIAVRVSFPGIGRPVWVAAKSLHIRVMNDQLPSSLKQVDKVAPEDRRRQVEQFWLQLGPTPLGAVAPGILPEFWRPGVDAAQVVSMPTLHFGQGRRLDAPSQRNAESYQDHYRDRATLLARAGSYSVPPAMARKLYFAYPETVSGPVRDQLAKDLSQAVSTLTGYPIDQQIITYREVSDAAVKLRSFAHAGAVVFVLDERPDTYYEAALLLDSWRVKRITQHTLLRVHGSLSEGKARPARPTRDSQRGQRRWKEFVDKNALQVVQLLDVVPFRIDQAGPYEAQLVIDVSHDRRHFAVSLLIARNSSKSPAFLLSTHVQAKVDPQHEAINDVILQKALEDLFRQAIPRRATPLDSLLILRDGRVCGQEAAGIARAGATWRNENRLTQPGRVDVVNLHKETLKGVRLWEIEKSGAIVNPLEGTLVRLNSRTVLLTTTGAASLHQGTAQPILLTAQEDSSPLMDAATAVFAGAQLNWSSPGVAQRLPEVVRKADEELTARAAQEIPRLR